MVTAHETDIKNEARAYAAQLQELDRGGYEFTAVGKNGRLEAVASETGRQPLPLSVTVDGQPQSVLFTLSVGDRHATAGLPPVRNGVANAVNGAAKTFAVVRTPYSTEAARLVELSQAELAAGSCDVSTQPQNGQPGRAATPIPGLGEQPLRLEVPVTQDQWDTPVGLRLEMQPGPQGDTLHVQQSGPPSGYNFVAQQV